MKNIHFFLSFVLIFSTNILIAQGPTFGNTGTITICVNGTYYLNPSTTNGTFSTLSSTIATINSSGYVTGVSVGTTTVSLVTGGVTVTATVTVGSSSGLSIADPLAQPSYKFNNNPQGPIGGLNNYVGYNGYDYSSQARPSNTGFFRASNQLANAASCPYEYYIFRCTTCGSVTEYATRPQGTLTGNTIQSGSTGQLTYTSSNGGGPFTIVYLPAGGSNVTVNNISSTVAFNVASGTVSSTTTYTLISVTDESTNASTDFSGTIATVSIVPPPTATLTGSPSICPGGTANLTLSLTGTGSITVTLNNGTVVNTISGTTTISVSPTINTTYTISSVIDLAGSGTSTGSATVTIYAPASITVQPVSSATIIEGATTTLSVTATGEPTLSYQWYQDGSAISGANSYSYTTTNTTSAAGTYYVTVSTTCNVVSSTTSTVSVTARPQGTLTGNTILPGGSTGQLTYTSSNGGGPFTIVYQPSGGSNVTVNNISSTVAFNVASGTPSVTTTYTLVSVTDQTTTASRTSGFTGGTATITISSDYVTIGTQDWTNKNLDVTTYRNGDIIPQVTDATAWAGLTTGAWTYYNNDAANGAVYGKLYNWYAVTDPRGLAPAGWHVPTDAEWTTLSTFLGGDAAAGGKMKTTDRWNSPNTAATNSSFFAGLPGGYRSSSGTFNDVGNYGYWWSATEVYSTSAWYRFLYYNDGFLYRLNYFKEVGFSVRCLRDFPTASLTGTQSICSGTTTTLNLTTTGTGSITVTLNNGTIINTISGTTTISVSPTINTTYTISSVIDLAGSGTSTGSATVTIYAPASITVQPVSSATIIEGATTTLSVTATGEPTLSYQWYQDGSAISGANSYSYTTTNTTSAAGTYYVTVSTTCNVVSSTTSTVSVTARPQGTLTGNTILPGGSTGQLTYTSSNGGGPFTIVYQPSGGSNVTVNNISSTVAFNVASGTPSVTTTYTLVSVTDQTTTASRTSGFTGGTATITISSDYVTIGTQDWTNKNLDVTTYRNGDIIPQVTDATAWAGLTTGAWTYYNNDAANGAVYGKLYNWYAVTDPRGLAPAGWHVPTDAEWTTLSTFLGGDAAAGGKMKTTDRWNSPNTAATNSSFFAGLPGGARYGSGALFYDVGYYGFWWSASEYFSTNAWYRDLGYFTGTLNRYNDDKGYGFSVRCLRD